MKKVIIAMFFAVLLVSTIIAIPTFAKKPEGGGGNPEVWDAIADLQQQVDDETEARIAADNELQNQLPSFGAIESKARYTEYVAETDGFVLAWIEAGWITGYAKEGIEPFNESDVRAFEDCGYNEEGSFTMPVRKDERWKVDGNGAGDLTEPLYLLDAIW